MPLCAKTGGRKEISCPSITTAAGNQGLLRRGRMKRDTYLPEPFKGDSDMGQPLLLLDVETQLSSAEEKEKEKKTQVLAFK